MSYWLVIRHAESVANAQGVLSGWQDVPLSATGIQQAIALGQALAEENFELVLSSDLQRATTTAQLALQEWAKIRGCKVPPIHTDQRFRERDFRHLTGKPKSQLRATGMMRKILQWESAPDGIESYHQLQQRVWAAMCEWQVKENTILFAHGGVVRVLLTICEPKQTTAIVDTSVQNAHPIRLPLPIIKSRNI